MCLLSIHMLGSKWRLFQKVLFIIQMCLEKCWKILEKSGKSQGILSGTKCRSHDFEPVLAVVNVSSIDLDDRQHLRETLDTFKLMRGMIWEVYLAFEHHCRHWCDVVWKTILVPAELYSSVLSLKVEKSYFNRSDCTVKNHDENCKLRIPRCKQH